MDAFLHRAPSWLLTLLTHNWPLLLYMPLICWAAARAYLQPSRPHVLLLYGAMVLILAFEYSKHGTPVVQATSNYLFGELEGARSLSQFLLVDILAPCSHLVGIVLILLAALSRRALGRVQIPVTMSVGGSQEE